MFGFIIFVLVLSFLLRPFSRPYYGYRRPRIYPFGLFGPFGGYGGFGGWGMPYQHGPMHYGGHHHHHPGCGRRW